MILRVKMKRKMEKKRKSQLKIEVVFALEQLYSTMFKIGV
jgi:hypothetical protein